MGSLNKDYSILGSMLGSSYSGKLPFQKTPSSFRMSDRYRRRVEVGGSECLGFSGEYGNIIQGLGFRIWGLGFGGLLFVRAAAYRGCLV